MARPLISRIQAFLRFGSLSKFEIQSLLKRELSIRLQENSNSVKSEIQALLAQDFRDARKFLTEELRKLATNLEERTQDAENASKAYVEERIAVFQDQLETRVQDAEAASKAFLHDRVEATQQIFGSALRALGKAIKPPSLPTENAVGASIRQSTFEGSTANKFAAPLAILPQTNDLSFSVVINTDGRCSLLKRTLDSLRYLSYPNFEVCVVYGPTNDGTRELVLGYGNGVKHAQCPQRNLSQSRNIGIALSSSDIVAFIDDDAVPEREWLSDLAKSYADTEVAAAGGFVYDNTGVAFQARYVTTNRRGYPQGNWSEAPRFLNFPFSENYPHLLGTNCSFRRVALLEIGGFDEEFEYFLDETDVCCRVNDAGYRIDQRSDAYVHHKFAPSQMRDEQRMVRYWYPLIKNRVYFGMRNGRHHHSLREIISGGLQDADSWEKNIRAAVADGRHTQEELSQFLEQADAAIRDGYERGSRPLRCLLSDETLNSFASPFIQFRTLLTPNKSRVICLVTQDFPPMHNGGIARYFAQLARSLAAAGHHVHVLTKGIRPDTVDFAEGVWVHHIESRHFPQPARSPIDPQIVPPHIWNYSQTMLHEVRTIHSRRRVDVVICPLWDCEPISFIVDAEFPVICALQTTMQHWLENQPERVVDDTWMQEFGKPIMAMEELIIRRAALLQGNSKAIVADIQRLYGMEIPAERLGIVAHGMEDWASGESTHLPPQREHGIRLLFVGRLESRKGIDVLLEIAPYILSRFPEAGLDIVGDDTILRSNGSTYKREFLNLELPETVRSRITFHGRVDDPALRAFYRNCDIFVAPSRYESFGLVFLEAMMFGKPVIACACGGVPEVVTHGVTGILVKPGDPTSLSEAIATLVSDDDRRRTMGAAARADYELRFTDHVMREGMERMVDRILLTTHRAGDSLIINGA